MEPKIIQIPVGILETNCYLVYCPVTYHTAIIDPGDETEKIISKIEKEKLLPQFIINTHSHFDHTGGNEAIRKYFKIPLFVSQKEFVDYPENFSSPDKLLKEGEIIFLGKLKLEIILTPGHTSGGISIVVGKNIFTGDTLFFQGVGRTDLAGGSAQLLKKSLIRLSEFPDDYKIFPGHGPISVLREEKKYLSNLF